MSTTVTYKGSTLTTVENATKKLTTQGTWLEDDITITDVSSGGGGSVVVVDTPDSHGGTIREITAQNVVSLQGQKQVTLTQNPQTITPDTGYDGFASVVVDAGTIGTVTQDENGYLVLSPNGGGSGWKYKTGSFTPAQDYKTITNVNITNTTTIGFVPTLFIFQVDDKADLSGIQYAVVIAEYNNLTNQPFRITTRYSTTTNTLASSATATSWTTQTNYYLYYNNNNIYLRTTDQFLLKANVKYNWYAFE